MGFWDISNQFIEKTIDQVVIKKILLLVGLFTVRLGPLTSHSRIMCMEEVRGRK